MSAKAKKITRTFKTNKDPAYRIPTVKVEIKGGIATVIRKDKNIRIEITNMDVGNDNDKDNDKDKEQLGKTSIIPSYEKV